MAKKEKIEEQEQDEGSDSDEWKPEAGEGEDEEDTESDDVINESDEDDEGNPVRGVVTKGRNKTVSNRKKEEKRKLKGRKNDSVKSKRPRHICPLKECRAEIIDLPRHLRDVHNWTRDTAKKATSRFGMRKSFQQKTIKETSETGDGKKMYKDYHRHRPCPIEGCKSIVKRLSGHLRQVHKEIPVGSPAYKEILRKARAAKTWKPSNQVVIKTGLKKAEVGEQEKVTESIEEEEEEDEESDIEPSEIPSNDEEHLIMESAEDPNCLSAQKEIHVISSFCAWLESADGGRKDPKLSKQHASQLFRMLETIDPEKQINSLFNRTLVRDTFLKEHAETKYTADTIKAYLLSLRHFCSFVIAEKPESVDANTVLVNQIREKARLWSMSYKKDSKRRHLEKMSRDLDNLVTPEMVNKFEKSDSARSAIGYIEQLSGTNSLDLNQSVYTLVRDYILLQITIANAHRSGVLSNMTLEEYKQAKRREESVIISVKNHKTADTHGPACVVLSPSLFSYLEIYVNKVRSRVDHSTTHDKGRDQANVFLSWNGAKLESGQISTAINAAWQKGGMEGHVTSTLFRKSAVTNVHSRHHEMKSNLADLMAHKESTAQRFYRLQEKQESCFQAATNLPNVMRSSKTNTASQQDNSAARSKSADVIQGIGNKSTSTRTEGFTERMSWKEEDVKALREIFSEEIKAKTVTMAIVRQKTQDHPSLQSIDPKKVCERIRSEWRFGAEYISDKTSVLADSKHSEELPGEEDTLADKMSRYFSNDDSSASMVPPSNSSYISRNIFSDEHREYLLRVCGSMVRRGVISQTGVKDILSKDEEGREMLQKFSIKQLINRLKYEKRMNRKSSST